MSIKIHSHPSKHSLTNLYETSQNTSKDNNYLNTNA